MLKPYVHYLPELMIAINLAFVLFYCLKVLKIYGAKGFGIK